jgi:pimeloyl-ACP methyl ester carboxylesterase
VNRRTGWIICSALVASVGLSTGPLPAFALDGRSAPPSEPPASDVTGTVTAPQDLLPTDFEFAEGQRAEVNGIELYYEVYGEGEPLFLLHGGLANGTYWVNQIPAFAEQFQVIVVDSRGHGRSTFDDQPITYDLMSSDVLALADLLGFDTFGIVGWSDGGIIGLDIAINHPERLTEVVAYGANSDVSGLDPEIANSDLFNAFIEAASEDYAELSPAPERWEEFLANIGEMWATLPDWSAEQLAAITTPFLILDGREEEAILTSHAIYLFETIPNSALALMPETGHFAMFERPDEFNAIVLAYLNR